MKDSFQDQPTVTWRELEELERRVQPPLQPAAAGPQPVLSALPAAGQPYFSDCAPPACQARQRRRPAGRILLQAVACLLLAAVCFSAGWMMKGGAGETEKRADSTSGRAAVQGADGFYQAGLYEAGTDIPAGEYFLRPDSEYGGACHVYQGKYAGAMILAYETFYGQCYLSVEEGEILYVEDAAFIPERFAPANDPFGGYAAGQYKVGKDIAPGNYVFRGGQEYGGWVSVDTTSRHYSDMRDNLVFEVLGPGEERAFTLEDGQYVTLVFVDAAL